MADPVVGALPDADVDYAVVVPIRDRADELDRLLASVEPGRPVIVVDDASLRPRPLRAVAARHGATLVRLETNVGPGGARNAGLAHVETPFVVFCDSDVVLEPDTVRVLLRHFADPQVAMVVPRITALDVPGSNGWLGRYEQARSSLDLGKDPASVRPRSPVAWASTACVVARVDALGPAFDAGMRIGEDVDLGWRLVEEGWRIRYEPSVEARHEHRTRLWDWFTRKLAYGTGAAPLARRHPRDIAPAVLAPWSAAMLVALAAQRRWSVPVALAIGGVTSVRIARRLTGIEHPLRWGAWLTANGALGALAQGSALLLRHWVPATIVALPFSRRLRRATAVAAVLDVALEYRRTAAIGPIGFAVARRLDDLAYGIGVWWSALRAGSLVAITPDLSGTSRDPAPAARRAQEAVTAPDEPAESA